MLRALAAVVIASVLLVACGGGSKHHKPLEGIRRPVPVQNKASTVAALASECRPAGGFASLLDGQAQATFYGCTHPKLVAARAPTLPDARVNTCLDYALGAATGRNKAVLKANGIKTAPPPPPESALKALTVTCMLAAPGPPPPQYRAAARPRK